jgi:FkbM family methyltransferase
MRAITVTVPGGEIVVDADDWTTAELIARGWERELSRMCARLIRRGHTVLDVGAHVGMYTVLFASQVGAGGRVHAFEPLPANLALLADNVAHNGYGAIVQLAAVAVADTPGERVLHRYVGDRYPGGSTMLHSLVGGADYTPEATVAVVTLDQYSDEHGLLAADFIKIDAEGAELRILRGAHALIARSPGIVLLVELHPTELAADGSSVADVVAELEGMGLITYSLEQVGDEARPRARAPGEPVSGHVLLARRA